MEFSFQQYLVYILPGFLTVWTFRYFTKSKKSGDFELLGLSLAWGFILFILLSLFWWHFALILQLSIFAQRPLVLYKDLKNKNRIGLVSELFLILILLFSMYFIFKYRTNYEKFPENEYIAALISSLYGCIIGFMGSHISKSKNFKKFIELISPK